MDEGVPSRAASLDDLLVCVPNDVTEIVATQIFPDVFDRVQFRGIGGRRSKVTLLGIVRRWPD